MRYYYILMGLIFFQISQVMSQTIAIEDYQSDIEYLKENLPKKHPNLFFYQRKKDFHRALANIATVENLSTSNKLQISMQLREAIANLGDPHTNFGFYQAIYKEGFFPLEIHWLSDGIWIVGAAAQHRNIIGTKLTAINNIPIEKVIEHVSKVVPRNEPYFVKKRMHHFLMSNGILKSYNITKGEDARFTFETLEGTQKTITVRVHHEEVSVDDLEHATNSMQFWQRPQSDTSPMFHYKFFEEDGILYIQYNRCWGRELEERFGNAESAKNMPYFNEFKDDIFALLDTKSVEKVIFDLRFNGGGSSSQGTKFIEQLSKNKKINKKGKLFVAISAHTFSSAVINAMNFRQFTKAIIIGKPSGGAPNHYGEVRTLTLPKTKLKIYHSTKYFKFIKKDMKAVFPDVELEMNYSDIMNNIDPVYEFVKNYKR